MKESLIALSLILFSGCYTSKVTYVPESEKVESIIHNGVEGYFVPKSKMIQLTEEHIKYNYYLKKYSPLN